MKKILSSLLITALFVLFCSFANLGIANTREKMNEVAETAVNSGNEALNQSMHKHSWPAWLQRTDVGVGLQQEYKPTIEITTIQPFYSGEENTVFWQGRVSHQSDDYTFNIGLGYRYLLPSQNWMYGINTFYDATREEHHQRVGVGGEVFGHYVTLRANYYQGVTPGQAINTNGNLVTYEKALNGYDGSLETPIPYMPWIHLVLGTARWLGDNTNDTITHSFGLRMNPISNLELNLGTEKEIGSSWKAFVEASWYLDRPAFMQYRASDRIFSSDFMPPIDVSKHKLEKVRRHNDIVVEKYVGDTDTGLIVIKRGT